MKNRLASILLSGAVVLGLTGCADDGGSGDSTTTTPITTTSYDQNEGYEGDFGVEVTDGVTLKYIGVYDLTKAGDVRPAYNVFKEEYNAKIEVEIVPDAEIMTKLATYISSDMSPDLVDRRDNTFPYFIGRSMYEPLDSYMDMSAPQWASVADILEGYAVKGKHYYYPWSYIASGNFMIYNRALFEEFGVDDPVELYNAGQWTWNEFYQCMIDFVSRNDIVDDPIGLYGHLGTAFINTTGKAIVSYENGLLVNNMRSTEVERAQAFLEGLRKEGLSHLMYGEYNNVAHEPVLYGYAAFQSMGDWKIADYAAIQKNDEDVDIMFLPYPRDPAADQYYYSSGTFGYLVPAGSKNAELGAAFINCVRLSQTDPELMEDTKESIMKNKKYTDEQYEMWKTFQSIDGFSSSQLVIDYITGLDATMIDDVIVPMLENAAFDQSAEQQSWSTVREAYYGMIDDNVQTLNAVLGN